MPFYKIVGIDWSGAKRPRQSIRIQVAEYTPADGTVQLARPPRDPAGAWSRKDVLEYVQQEVKSGTVLIGLDFDFAYPYCDEGAYFPCELESPPDFQQLWETVEQLCDGVNNLYGGPFYRDDDSPFRKYHRYPDYEGDRYQIRYRITDQAAQQMRLTPSSVFNCIGPATVGVGSMAGMRLLQRIRQLPNVCIWPFDVNGPPDGSTVVEIYPRLFVSRAERAGIPPDPAHTYKECAHFGAKLQNPPAELTGDQRDALVSAAGMGWLARQELNWQVPACAATHEGWIFRAEVQ